MSMELVLEVLQLYNRKRTSECIYEDDHVRFKIYFDIFLQI